MKPIYVTQTRMPSLEKYSDLLSDIWKNKWVTNNGKYHQLFERAICRYLKVDHCNLLSNGTLALIIALQALRITGEVITTPFSFVATTHALHWNGITPVFCDIDEKTLNIDPDKIESLITPKTTAILPVHVYGNPCNNDKLSKIADTYGLKLIYDAAHTFGVTEKSEPVVNYGDVSILSFHATKVFNTIEGGAIITPDANLKNRIDYLKNFGFADEVTVIAPGINAKMNELQAAYGLLELELIDDEIQKRKKIAEFYRNELGGIQGITFLNDMEGVKHNYSYFPVFVNFKKCKISRDSLYEELKKKNIYSRRYFYPLISEFPTYRGLPSASASNLQVAGKMAGQVLCLPIYGELQTEDAARVVETIRKHT